MSKVALITGITGQDGSYLAELLLSKGYKVHGIVRRVALEDETHRLWRIRKILKDVTLHAGSLESYASLFNIILKIKPTEVYHLAAQSYVGYSFEDEFSTLNININGTHYLLSATKEFISSKVRFYFAGSSEMFGKVKETPQNENTLFYPRSSYGISKVTGYYLTKNYRDAYNLHASNGILFNHESPRRGLNFVTRKITHSLARILSGYEKKIYLGDISTKRDWGHSRDYVKGIWMILQYKNPEDFVLSTGKNYSIEDFVKKTFNIIGLNWKKFVTTNNKKFLRPSEVRNLQGDSKKARKLLKWKPVYNLDTLCLDMLENDLKLYGMTLNQAKKIAKKLSN